MEKSSNFQERFLLSLDFDNSSTLIKSVLRSPLGLAVNLVKCLFENNFERIRGDLDSIKEFVAGVKRAESLGNSYGLAKFYPNLFAFHQYFHSSYRARQGKTLEEFIKEVLRETNPELKVPDKLKSKIKILSEIFKGYKSRGDIDVLVQNNSGVMAVQLRSNVNTGGTTAKSSLVEALRTMLSLPKDKNKDLFYHVGVWEKEGNQKTITKSKFFDLLEHQLIPLKIRKDKFMSEIEKGLTLKPGISLKLSFGKTEILKSIKKWLGNPGELKDTAIKDMIIKLENWDDLWVAYSVASMEIQSQKVKEFNNIEYLNQILKKFSYDTKKFRKNKEFVELASELSLKVLPLWEKPSIPLNSPSDKVHYIRDLILLKFIYDRLFS